MKSLLAYCSAFAITFVLAGASMAQLPPDISRWSGSQANPTTAITPVQGYGMGNPLTLTWGFAQEGTLIPSFNTGSQGNSNLIFRLDQIYGAGPGGTDLTQRPWFQLFQSVFDRWSSISGLSYIYEANDNGVAFSNSSNASNRGVLGIRADVRIGGRAIDGNSGILAFNFFPNVGDMVIDTGDNFYSNTSNNSRGLRNVVAHEHGHGLGMDHLDSNNSAQLMEPFLSTAFDGPQYHDILMAHRGYGDFNEKSNGGLGNDIVSRATSLGAISDGGSVSIGNSARSLVVAPTATDFVSIDDQSDTDFYSFTVDSAGTVNVLLEALGFTYNAGPQGGAQSAFDTLRRSDLALAIFDTDMLSLLGSANNTGLGGSESLNDILLDHAGTYFVRVSGISSLGGSAIKTQFYGLSVGFTASAIPEPATGMLMTMIAFGTLIQRRRKAHP